MSSSEGSFGFKVVFVGNSGAGKTSAIERFCVGRVPDAVPRTLCSQFYERAVEVRDAPQAFDLMLWDTPGRENLSPLAADSFPGSNICVVFYSFTDRASFEAVPQWVEKVKAVAMGVQVVLVENKIDRLDDGRVEFADAQRMAAQLEAPLFHISVVENLNLRNLFVYLLTTLQGKFLSSLSSLPVGSDAFFVANADDRFQPETDAALPQPAQGDAAGCNVV
jgi:Ras-related protein Rab-23